MNKQLLKTLSVAVHEVAPSVPRMLAAYIAGDHIRGRSLWNSPLEFTFIIDIDDNNNSRFSRRFSILPNEEFDQLKDAVEGAAGSDYRYEYRLSKLLAGEDGRITLFRQRFTPDLYYYRVARGVTQGVLLFAAPDFLLEKFNQDMGTLWADGNEFEKNSISRLKGLVERKKLAPVENVKLPRMDTVLMSEWLLNLEARLNNTQEIRDKTFEAYIANFNYRSRLRYNWSEISSTLVDTARYIISRHSRYEPQSYLQLMDAMADMGILDHDDAFSLVVICEHPFKGPTTRKDSIEDAEVFVMMQDHIHVADQYLERVVKYLHGVATEN